MKKIVSLILVAVLCLGVLSACSLFEKPQSELLVATWTDSNSFSGYTFRGDGTVEVKLVNFKLPILGTVNQTLEGAYTTSQSEDGEKNYVTITYNLFKQTFENKYEFFVEDNVLTLTDIDDGERVIYIKQTVEITESAPSSTEAA